MRNGASSNQAYCVYGDHCACTDGFVCDDGENTDGECEGGTGATTHCIPPPTAQCTGDYDATDALANGPRKTNCGGSTGNGCMDYQGKFDSLTWTTATCQAGTYIAAFRYALGSGNRPLRVTVNDVDIVASQSFPGTGSWGSWTTVNVPLTLGAGTNTISLTGIGYSGGNFDKVSIIADGTTTPTTVKPTTTTKLTTTKLTTKPTTTVTPNNCKGENDELQSKIAAEKEKTAELQRKVTLMAVRLKAASSCKAKVPSECDVFGC